MKFVKIIFLIFIFVFELVLISFADDKIVNVLCYHRFKVRKITDKEKKKWGDAYSLKPEQFDEQMNFLKENRYNVITMKDYIDYMYGKKEIPEKTVIITIDDGYRCTYEYAYPILKKYGFKATIYLYQDFLPGGKNALTVQQIKEMRSGGFEFGCHSKSHPVLTKKGKMNDEEYIKFLEKEILGAKKYLEGLLNSPIDTFAYPYGSYSKEVHLIIKKAGYKLAFSVVPSYNTKDTDKFSLKRTMIYNSTTLDKFKAILEKKQLKIKDIYPDDGDVINDNTPELKATLIEDSHLNTTTIKFKMGRVVLKDSIYNPHTKMVSYSYSLNKSKLKNGTHVAKVIAQDNNGNEYESAWLFIVGKPTKMDLLENEKNHISEDIREE